MSAERIVYGKSDEVKALIREAKEHPVAVEVEGTTYEVNANPISPSSRSTHNSLPPSPYTIDTVRGSLAPLPGKTYISDDEIEAMIEAGKEANLRSIVNGMRDG